MSQGDLQAGFIEKMLRPNYVTRAIPAFVFLATAALYIRTTAPTLGGAFDSEEFQHVAYTLGIAHATGYPLYLILGKFFTSLVPFGNVAYRMNLLSAFLGAGAATLVYLNAMQLTQRRIASLAAAALFATNAAVWRQSGVASVGPLHLLLLAAIVYGVLLWHEQSASLALVAFLVGLGLTHHRTILFLIPIVALYVLLFRRQAIQQPQQLAKILLAFVFPLLLYLYIPFFGNNSSWYSNTLQGFIGEISGGDAGDFLRTTPSQIFEGIVVVSQYLDESFGYLGAVLIAIGAISLKRKAQSVKLDRGILLFLGATTFVFAVWGTLYAGEPDRYLVLPFAFLIYWFAIGASAIEDGIAVQFQKSSIRRSAFAAFSFLLFALLALPFQDRFRIADWSSFDRVYRQWNEIFTLPIPQSATVVGNWGQLNAMRYMQNVESRRRDLRPLGTLYDPAPQTEAAREAFEQQGSIYLAPGIAQPTGEYRYALLGPLLEVRAQPQTRAPDAVPVQKPIAINSALTLVGYGISTALEPYIQTQTITPTRTARVSLFWRADGSPKPFLVRLRLYDPETRVIAQLDEPAVRGLYPASQWTRGEYVNDVHNFLIPGGAPPGKYRLTLLMLDETKSQTSAEIEMAAFNIDRITTLTRDQVFVAHPVDITLNDRIAIVGYGGFEGAHRAGEMITFNLLWSTRENMAQDMTAFFALTNTAGQRLLEWQQTPIGYYPTREWQKGELLKAYYELKLPGDLQQGEISLAVGVSPNGAQTIGGIQIVPQ